MHDTLTSLVERALMGHERPLEFYLREHSRLPGPRANLELANDVSSLLAASVSKMPDAVRALINRFANGNREMVASNTPDEFVMLCGIIAFGTCTTAYPAWRNDTFDLLKHYACSGNWRVREAVTMAYQQLLGGAPQETMAQLLALASKGTYLQQRAAIAAVAEPSLLYSNEVLTVAIQLQQHVVERMRNVAALDRKSEDFKVLRQALGYTLSVVTAAAPEPGFALMRECATWGDKDITWALRENLKKKRLAKFPEDTQALEKLLS